MCAEQQKLHKNEQIKRNGDIVLDYDQKLSSKQINNLFFSIFDGVIRKDDKQFVLYEKIGILACNVTYLGYPHDLYKKRIQLKDYYLKYLDKNKNKGLVTFYVGIYTYNTTRLYVVFETDTYANNESHNSSAHVHTSNLQYAKRCGRFDKKDNFGNKIHVFIEYEFIRFMKSMVGDPLGGEEPDDIQKIIEDHFSRFAREIPRKWQGIKCYKELVEANDANARQNHWEGYYFEHLFKEYLKKNRVNEISWHSDKKKGGIDLDIVFNDKNWVYGDLKADSEADSIQGNDIETIKRVVKDNNGLVYYICCRYKFEKDSQHGYRVTKYWNSLRDEKKQYKTVSQLESRFGKTMKYSVKPKYLCVLKIDSVAFDILKQNPRKQGHNSNGKPRPDKIQIFKDKVDALSVLTINFD